MSELFSGRFDLPGILLHGGAGRAETSPEKVQLKREAIEDAAQKSFQILRDGGSAKDAVVLAVELLESCPLFNAGLGAALQSDGVARLSASIMDGPNQRFSAVALAENIIHPIQVALSLQQALEEVPKEEGKPGARRRGRVLGPPGLEQRIQELSIVRESPVTDETLSTWKRYLTPKPFGSQKTELGTGTVGAVAIDIRGRLFAATSTGGFGADAPGRMSDVSSVAGNFASVHAAISATGVGEEIVDSGLAVRIETRVRDGLTLEDAGRKTLLETEARSLNFGWISVDARGNWLVAYSTPDMVWTLRSLE